MEKRVKKLAYDKLGLSLSLLCGIHCLLMPVVLTAMPLTAASLFSDPLTEWLIILPGLFLSGYFLVSDYRKHGKKPALVIFSLSAAAMIGEHLFINPGHSHTFYLTPVAASALFVAYFMNWRANRHSHTCAH